MGTYSDTFHDRLRQEIEAVARETGLTVSTVSRKAAGTGALHSQIVGGWRGLSFKRYDDAMAELAKMRREIEAAKLAGAA